MQRMFNEIFQTSHDDNVRRPASFDSDVFENVAGDDSESSVVRELCSCDVSLSSTDSLPLFVSTDTSAVVCLILFSDNTYFIQSLSIVQFQGHSST